MRLPVEIVGVVVARQDYGEHDRVVRILTPERGLVALYAAGARRARSPYGGLDPGVRARVRAREGRDDALWRLASAEVEDGRVGMRRSYARMLVALYACELCGALSRPDHPEPRLYGLLETALLLLDAASEDPRPAFLAGIEGKALSFAGLAPVLERCVVCEGALDGELVFDVLAGGVAHLGCRADGPSGQREPVTAEFARALEACRRRPLRESLDLGLPPGPPRVLGDALEVHLARPLNSRAALAGLPDAPERG